MPIDASIISGNKPPQFDPLAVVGKANEVGKGILSNRLLGQEIGGKEALGRAITAATDPVTGVTDQRKAAALLGQDKEGAFALPAYAAQVQEQEGKGLANQKAMLELAAARWTKVGDTATALLAEKTPLTRDGVLASLRANLVQSGMFSDPDSSEKLTTLAASLPEDDAGIRAKLKEVGLQSNMTMDRINALLGPVSTVDTGSTVVQQRIPGVTGVPETIGAVKKDRTPQEKAQLVPVYDAATGKTNMVPSGQVMGDAPAGQKPVAIQSAPAVGEPETAQAGVQQAQQLRVAADKAPVNMAALKNIRAQVDSFTPGAKTNWIYAAKALATQMGVAPTQMRDEVAAQEEFNKLATMFINQQVGALGGSGTDSKLESAAKGSPNEFMSKEGIKGVVPLMMGLEQAVLVKNEAWQKWLNAGKAPGSYGEFQTEFNRRFNPRVYQAQFMNEKQQQMLLRSMDKDERERFKKDEILARRYGWIK